MFSHRKAKDKNSRSHIFLINRIIFLSFQGQKSKLIKFKHQRVIYSSKSKTTKSELNPPLNINESFKSLIKNKLYMY